MIAGKRDDMDSKRIFLLPVIISIIGHTALITASSMVDLRNDQNVEKLFTVQIEQPSSSVEPRKEENPANEKRPAGNNRSINPPPETAREDTVDIGSADVKYAAYLSEVKKKILRIWKYPAAAYEKNEEGVVVIKLSIDAGGALTQITLVNSSGFDSLDSGTLDVVNAAAPFQPLPGQYELSRLHIIASFNYRIKD